MAFACAWVSINRYHPAFQKAREIFESGVMGEFGMRSIRARYGHGGRVGYDKECGAPTRSYWRAAS